MARPRKTPVQPVTPREPAAIRPPMRTTRDAAARAREILGDADEIGDGADKYYINPDVIPDGWDYQWRRKEVLGKEDPAYMVSLLRAGWEPVPADRHPDMMPIGWSGSIERDGLVLMERPMEITLRARSRELRAAQGQVKAKEEQLGSAPAGHFERDAHAQTRPKVSKSYAPMQIPGDA